MTLERRCRESPGGLLVAAVAVTAAIWGVPACGWGLALVAALVVALLVVIRAPLRAAARGFFLSLVGSATLLVLAWVEQAFSGAPGGVYEHAHVWVWRSSLSAGLWVAVARGWVQAFLQRNRNTGPAAILALAVLHHLATLRLELEQVARSWRLRGGKARMTAGSRLAQGLLLRWLWRAQRRSWALAWRTGSVLRGGQEGGAGGYLDRG